MIVIIGGGIAGLYAATKLIGKPVTILEKSHRLGGCICTHYEKGLSYETGAGRFNKYHKLLLKLLKEYGLTPVQITNTKKIYKPVLCKTVTATLQRVLDYAKEVSVKILKSITFLQLCNTAVGFDKAQYLMKSFGYNAEFQIANAYASIRIFEEDFKEDVEYYYCKEGLSELVKRMEERLLQNGVIISKKQTVTDISTDLVVTYSTGKIQASRIVLAVPKESLIKMSLFTKDQKDLLNTVTGVTLHRIYAKYEKPWFDEISRTTTDLPLRQFIPINREKAIAMASYSDMHDADFWNVYKKNGTLEAELKKQLEMVFTVETIPKTTWLRSYYWKNAVHAWNAGVDPIKIQRALKNIHPNVAIVGESYSFRQGWIEGALESVEKNL
jgi:protoporphyrinogen oxidase